MPQLTSRFCHYFEHTASLLSPGFHRKRPGHILALRSYCSCWGAWSSSLSDSRPAVEIRGPAWAPSPGSLFLTCRKEIKQHLVRNYGDIKGVCFNFRKPCSLSAYPVQWQPVCFSPLDWAAALCEWRGAAPASRCQIAGRWTAAGRSSDTPGWPRSSPSPGFALDDALHSSITRRYNTPATLNNNTLSFGKSPCI